MTRSAFDEIRDDEYSEAVEAREIGQRLIETKEKHEHLRDATIGYLWRDDEIRRGDHVIDGTAFLVSSLVQGPSQKYWRRFIQWSLQRTLGFVPDFLLMFDRNLWNGYDERRRVALVDHELEHCAQATDDEGEPRYNRATGDPIWRVKEHDVEEFFSVIEDHGLVKPEHAELARVVVNAALRDAGEADNPPVAMQRETA